MKKLIERRYAALNFELRATGEDGGKKMVGYAAVFNQLSEDLGGFREQIAPGAFSGALEDDVRALWNHDQNHVLGRTKNGTLRLKEDKHGLLVEIDPPDTQMARDVMASIERGDVDQMSFAFSVKAGGEHWAEVDGQTVRTLLDVSLFDVSPVTYPAYHQTEIQARSILDRAVENKLLPGEITTQETPQMRNELLRKKLNLKTKEI